LYITLVGFLISLAVILLISQKNLPLALILGALILGLFTLPLESVIERTIYTVSSRQVLLLALAMGIIPLIGGTMKENGQVDDLVNNIQIPQRYVLPLSAALMGFLPMPGGALLSAPILEKGGTGVKNDLKAAINNWFRHLLIFIYPLSPALIVSAEIAGLDVYHAMLYLFPGLVFAAILGYLFYLRLVDSHLRRDGNFSLKGLLIPLMIIFSAPLVDFFLKKVFLLGNLSTVIAVIIGLSLSIILGRVKVDMGRLALKMKPWNFALIIIGMFYYLYIFQKSNASDLIAILPLPPLILSITAGFILGVATGRVQLPASIILPIYLSTGQLITPVVFALIYIAIFFGYVISPVHPCLVVTCEYFHVPVRDMIKKLALPTLIIFATVLAAGLIVIN
jgi:integral membrane protein (TIGR00529 family)